MTFITLMHLISLWSHGFSCWIELSVNKLGDGSWQWFCGGVR